MEKALPEVKLKALSIDPERTEKVCDVEAVKLESPKTLVRSRRRYLKLFKETDACLVTGGTPFYDYGHISRAIHMGLPALNEKKLICFGVGSKPITSLKGREITRVLVGKSSLVSTRDNRSKDILQSIVKPRARDTTFPMTVTGDSALMMAPEIRAGGSGNKVFFCPRRLSSDNRSLYHERLEEATIKRIRHMQARTADRLATLGYDVCFLPFHTVPPDDDREEIRMVRNLMSEDSSVLPRPDSPLHGLELISSGRLVVGLRLHSLVLAASCGVPFSTVDYDIKMRGFMEHLGVEDFCVPSTGRVERLSDVSEKVLENEKKVTNILHRRVGWMRNGIQAEAKKIARLIDRDGAPDKPVRLLRDTQNR